MNRYEIDSTAPWFHDITEDGIPIARTQNREMAECIVAALENEARMREAGDLMAERLISLRPEPFIVAWKCDDCGRKGTNDSPLPEHSPDCSVGKWQALAAAPRPEGDEEGR